jgi:hypothetical protein
VLAEDWNNKVFAGLCKSDDWYSPIVGAFRTTDQSFFEQAIDSHADGTRSEMDLRANRVYGQRPPVQQGLEDAEVRVGNTRLLESLIQIVGSRLVRFPPNELAMLRI